MSIGNPGDFKCIMIFRDQFVFSVRSGGNYAVHFKL